MGQRALHRLREMHADRQAEAVILNFTALLSGLSRMWGSRIGSADTASGRSRAGICSSMIFLAAALSKVRASVSRRESARTGVC